MAAALDGFLVVDKPPGITSHDVVDEIRRRLRTRRVGHAGTLDPEATGVLVIGVGKATRLLSLSQAQPKAYRAGAAFGVSTTTQDASGEVVGRRSAQDLTPEAVRALLPRFTGAIEQVPPMVSAVKVGGERLYRKALRGEEVERPRRTVTIHELSVSEFEGGAHPHAVFDVRCSSGTYIRTLVHDIGEALGCGAHVTLLRRTEAGGFGEADAVPLADVRRDHLVAPAEALRFLPAVALDDAQARLVMNGRRIPATMAQDGSPGEGGLVRLLRDDDLIAVYRRDGANLVAQTVIPR